jgi:very-short-patch-repair endonuclease
MFARSVTTPIFPITVTRTIRTICTDSMLDADKVILPLFRKRPQMLAYLRKNFVQDSDYVRHRESKKCIIKITPSTAGIIAIRKQHRIPNREAIQNALSFITGREASVTIKSNIEFDTISVLERALSMFDPTRQFRVQPYRVDLYLRKLNVCIECDEHGHASYPNDSEMRRQRRIESYLGCGFVRYNPNDPEFNIGDVIRQILSIASKRFIG